MKFLVVLTFVAIVAGVTAHLSPEKRAKLEEYKKECIPETGAAEDSLDKFLAGDFSNKDKTTKCFAKCIYQKAGFFDKDNNLDVKVAIEKIGKDHGAENAEKWVTSCKDIENKDPCEKAYEMYQCVYKNKQAGTKQ